MVHTILQTKLYRPTLRSELVARSRLTNILEASLSGQLTLLSAPAGFGKTTLIANWLQTRQASTQPQVVSAWLSLDETDNDLNRFLLYFISALQTIDRQLGESALAMLTAAPPAGNVPPTKAIMSAVINALAASKRPIVLVLDDYHLITTETIHQALIFLLENSPPKFQLIITSRTEPPLRLPRLRVRGLLTEIGVNELRFTRQETADFLNRAMNLNLSEADIDRLDDRTEGWIASLQLAAVSLKNEADSQHFVYNFTGNDRQIMDYLLDEVLERQPEYIRDFLVQTSILQRLNVQLCNQVTAQVGSQQILEDLEQANLFVMPLDNIRHWYRYHPLFAEFLQAHLQRKTPDQISHLHLRASEWYAANDFIAEAIEHAIKAQAYDYAAQLMGQVAFMTVWGRGQVDTIGRWISKLPIAIRRNNPALLLLNGWALQALGQWDALEQQLDEIRLILADFPDSDQLRDMQGQALALWAEHSIYRHDFVRADNLLQQARPLLSEKSLSTKGIVTQEQGYIYRLNGEMEKAEEALLVADKLNEAVGNVSGQLFTLYDLAELARMRADLNQAEAIYQRMLRIVELPENQANLAVCSAHIGLGQLWYRRNELPLAADHFSRGIELSHRAALGGFARLGYIGLAYIHQISGDIAQADQFMAQAIAQAQRSGTTWVIHQAEMAQAQVWIRQGNLEQVTQWHQALLNATEGQPFIPVYQQHQAQIVIAQLYQIQGKQSTAFALLQQLQEIAQASGWRELLIDVYLHLTLTDQQNTHAPEWFAKALTLAEPSNYLRPFLDLGDQHSHVIDALLAHQPASSFGAKLRQAFPQHPKSATSNETTFDAVDVKTSDSLQLAEPLTKREIEIIQLIAAGMSNREIAAHLVIALGTVGKHTSNIFLKLDVPNRAAAVLRAQELGVI